MKGDMDMGKEIIPGVYQFNDSKTVLADGVWHKTDGTSVYLVESQSKLSSIQDAAPGDIAYTAGFGDVWQLETDGQTWTAVSVDVQGGIGSLLALRHICK